MSKWEPRKTEYRYSWTLKKWFDRKFLETKNGFLWRIKTEEVICIFSCESQKVTTVDFNGNVIKRGDI